MKSLLNDKGELQGLRRIHRGKVRDTYEIPPELQLHTAPVRLVLASDRISVYDFVLNAEVEDKGAILTAMNVFWRGSFTGVQHDLVAFGSQIDRFLPEHLRGNHELQKRAVIAESLQMFPIECIARGYLTGSGITAYRATNPHVVCGHTLPDGLTDGDKLPTPIFTPTTKAEVGHDEHVTARSVNLKYGPDMETMTLYIYGGTQEVAAARGVIIADTKFEFGRNTKGEILLADEVLTPDSSRFWSVDEHAARPPGSTPKSYDKQFVRDFAKSIGIDPKKRNPENPDDYAWVRAQAIDRDCLQGTTRIYHEIFERLVGKSLSWFQRQEMDISGWLS
jgi:phosphoribosylaminoimidazole-succinocarboxamide synthase